MPLITFNSFKILYENVNLEISLSPTFILCNNWILSLPYLVGHLTLLSRAQHHSFYPVVWISITLSSGRSLVYWVPLCELGKGIFSRQIYAKGVHAPLTPGLMPLYTRPLAVSQERVFQATNTHFHNIRAASSSSSSLLFHDLHNISTMYCFLLFSDL